MGWKSSVWKIMYYFQHELTLSNLLLRQKYKKRLGVLKDIHKGERCFVIGNGPSLTAEDLDLLKNEVTFAANRIFYIFGQTSWRPTFFCAQDTTVIQSCREYFPTILDNADNMFFASFNADYVPNDVKANPKTLFFFARRSRAHEKRRFSHDITKFVDGGGTITYTAIQLAAYMGFSEIYLLGVDNNYSATSFNNGTLSADDVKNSYFAGMPADIKLNKPNTDNNTLSFIAAKKYCDEHGIKIRNSTRGGKLELFGRESLESILGA